MITAYLFSVLCLALSCGAPAQASAAQTATAQSAAQSYVRESNYIIAANDLLAVNILDVSELSRDYRVSGDGTIDFPLLSKPVQAAGSSITQLQIELESQLKAGGFISHPHISIAVKESVGNSIIVNGAVKKPATFFVTGPVNVLDALSRAEGVSEDASSVVTITRGMIARRVLQGEGAAPQTVNLRQLFEGAIDPSDALVYPGDRVTVPRAGVIYVVGAVNRAGGFTLSQGRENMSVLQAIALAEGLRATAAKEKAQILRRGASGNEKQMIMISLNKILDGHSEDLGLRANDILFIPDSKGSRALHRGVEAILQAATGVAVYGRY